MVNKFNYLWIKFKNLKNKNDDGLRPTRHREFERENRASEAGKKQMGYANQQEFKGEKIQNKQGENISTRNPKLSPNRTRGEHAFWNDREIQGMIYVTFDFVQSNKSFK